jgi:hypothetical protein
MIHLMGFVVSLQQSNVQENHPVFTFQDVGFSHPNGNGSKHSNILIGCRGLFHEHLGHL